MSFKNTLRELAVYSQYKQVIAGCTLFKGIPHELHADALKFLKARCKTCQKDELIIRIGDEFKYGILPLSGSLEGSFFNENFDKVNMDHFTAGTLIGESLALAGTQSSPIQLRAITDCTLLLLDFHPLYDTRAIKHSYQLKISVNLISQLSMQNVFLNSKIQILSQKSLRDRVKIYLESLPKQPDGSVAVPFTKTALAEFMCVNRSALSRELGRMESEGLITPTENGYILNKK